jgi:hypothetical protein
MISGLAGWIFLSGDPEGPFLTTAPWEGRAIRFFEVLFFGGNELISLR